MLELGILIASSIVNIALAYIVYTKNPVSVTHRRFAVLAISLVTWSVVNYASVHPVFFSQLTWVRLTLFFAAFQALSVFKAFEVFPDSTLKQSSARERVINLYTAFVMLLTLTPFVFSGLKTNADGGVSPQPGLGIGFFMILVVAMLGGGLTSIIMKYRHSKGRRREQFRIVIAGLLGAFGLIFLTNFVMVAVFGVTAFIPLGATYTLVFSGAFAYAIIKHRLFDIRRAAARGVAYVLTTGFLATVYSLLIFGTSNYLVGEHGIDLNPQLVNTVLALAMALSFQTIKRFFDRLSNTVFYKDAYDPRLLLDQLNQALIAEVDVEKMLKKCSAIIMANLKSNGGAFVIGPTANHPLRIIGSHTNTEEACRFLEVQDLDLPASRKAVVADMLEGRHERLAQKMQELDMAVIIQLLAGSGRRSQPANGAGYLVLGPKSNGDPYSNEDIQLLEIISKELVIAIENAVRFEEIERFNETLQQKVDDATRKLRQTNMKLKQLNDSKDDFISMASHQLRTPLSSIKGYISLVMDGDAGKISPQQHAMLQQAFNSSQKMVYLIADLLNVSRLKTGKFALDYIPTNLAKLIGDELDQLKAEAASRQIELTVHTPAEFPTLLLDETKTRQVIMNFLDNAIYYTPAGGHIRAELKNLPRTVEFRVIDDGIGVPANERHQLFGKFYRAKNAMRTRPDGTGLGLYMAKKVIVAQGGAVIFESTEGKGSTFGFSLPKDPVPEV